ncbi:TetR/AcrR family transcriptional regulator [Streptomyces sp. FXJ1.4098]|nr:TetR/AcrR family transcriptional regulator [Streptomyces sp. FXJ1.4098]
MHPVSPSWTRRHVDRSIAARASSCSPTWSALKPCWTGALRHGVGPAAAGPPDRAPCSSWPAATSRSSPAAGRCSPPTATLGLVLPCGSAAGLGPTRVAGAGGIRGRNATHEGGPLTREVRLFAEIVNSADVRDAAALRKPPCRPRRDGALRVIPVRPLDLLRHSYVSCAGTSPTPEGRDVVSGRREQILEAALEVLTARGFKGTSIDAVAERAGLTRQGVLHYFPSKKRLLLGISTSVSSSTASIWPTGGSVRTGRPTSPRP